MYGVGINSRCRPYPKPCPASKAFENFIEYRYHPLSFSTMPAKGLM
jgi:hypothetical protein